MTTGVKGFCLPRRPLSTRPHGPGLQEADRRAISWFEVGSGNPWQLRGREDSDGVVRLPSLGQRGFATQAPWVLRPSLPPTLKGSEGVGSSCCPPQGPAILSASQTYVFPEWSDRSVLLRSPAGPCTCFLHNLTETPPPVDVCIIPLPTVSQRTVCSTPTTGDRVLRDTECLHAPAPRQVPRGM